MIQTIGLSRIHIKDLCSRCGVKQQVFYHHFSYGCLWLTIEWIENDCKLTPQEFAEIRLSYMLLKVKEAIRTQII